MIEGFFYLYTENLAKRLGKRILYFTFYSLVRILKTKVICTTFYPHFLYVQFSIAILLSNFTRSNFARYEKGLGGSRHKKSVPIKHKSSCIYMCFTQQKLGAELLASRCHCKKILTHSFFYVAPCNKCLDIRSDHQNVDGLTCT